MIYSEEQWLIWIDQLAKDEFVVIDNFFPTTEYTSIVNFFSLKRRDDSFATAGIGPEANRITEIRGDFTYWLDREKDTDLKFWFNTMDHLKFLLNRYCFLSLKSDEFHLAHYPKGSFYKKHLDQFNERNNRMITVLLYLNDDWKHEHQGHLKIYKKDESTLLLEPMGNRLVLFKSAELPHEVLPTTKGRNSLTGWLLYDSGVL